MLSGTRIKLRPIEKKDLQYLNMWKNDYDIFKYLGGGFQPQSMDEQQIYMDKLIFNRGDSKRFIIELEELPIGLVGLYDINLINRNCELGIYIGDKSKHGKGYAREATNIIINFAFNNLNLRKIKLNVISENKRAIKLYNSIGFNTVGVLKEERYINGEYKDLNIMELMKGEIYI